ncbi:DUF6491 family protein [Phenylobacterium sp.]|jgi:hypothetical protein|uniref:DUF6491 family protein n=1 Tax=Phenylobacterium sp. TaxID=1871053 RepID=UPI002F93A6D8
MLKKLIWAAPVAAVLALAAAPQFAGATSPVEPPAKAKPAKQCFWARNANGFAAPDDRTLNVRVGVREVFQFEMFGPCHEIDWAHQIALRSRGGSTICTGMDAEVISPSVLGPQRCMVRSVRKLTPAEIAALPKGARP